MYIPNDKSEPLVSPIVTYWGQTLPRKSGRRLMGEQSFESNPVDTAVGDRIKVKRTELGLSQAHMADQLGLPLDEYQNCESGVRRFGAQLLLNISRLLGVNPKYFFDNPPAGRSDFIH